MVGVPGYLVVSLGNKMDAEEMLSPAAPPLRTIESTLTFPFFFFFSEGGKLPLDARRGKGEGSVS